MHPQIVFGQQHARRLAKDVRLVVCAPEQLGRGGTGHRQIVGDLMQIQRAFVEFGAFLVVAYVVPEDRWAQYVVVRIEQRRAMHLT